MLVIVAPDPSPDGRPPRRISQSQVPFPRMTIDEAKTLPESSLLGSETSKLKEIFAFTDAVSDGDAITHHLCLTEYFPNCFHACSKGRTYYRTYSMTEYIHLTLALHLQQPFQVKMYLYQE